MVFEAMNTDGTGTVTPARVIQSQLGPQSSKYFGTQVCTVYLCMYVYVCMYVCIYVRIWPQSSSQARTQKYACTHVWYRHMQLLELCANSESRMHTYK